MYALNNKFRSKDQHAESASSRHALWDGSRCVGTVARLIQGQVQHLARGADQAEGYVVRLRDRILTTDCVSKIQDDDDDDPRLQLDNICLPILATSVHKGGGGF